MTDKHISGHAPPPTVAHTSTTPASPAFDGDTRGSPHARLLGRLGAVAQDCEADDALLEEWQSFSEFSLQFLPDGESDAEMVKLLSKALPFLRAQALSLGTVPAPGARCADNLT